VNHDPPVFIVGFAGGLGQAKDSLRNLLESGECVINIVSEHYIEAANATAVNAPYGVSEWALTGLTPAGCKDVKASRVKEVSGGVVLVVFEEVLIFMGSGDFQHRRQAHGDERV